MRNLIGRTFEKKAILAALRCHRHIILEGPVGVGKTHLSQLCCTMLKRPFIRINADDRYQPSQLTGHHDPSVVLKMGYGAGSFRAGPLAVAMQKGAILFINELNRLPELTQNVLLTAMDEGALDIPDGPQITAQNGFTIIGTQNPESFIGTQPLSESLKDRLDWLYIDYQPKSEELEILRTYHREAQDDLIEKALEIVRSTRKDPRFQRGASIRAAMAIVDLTIALDGDFQLAVQMALHNRVQLTEPQSFSFDALIAELEKKKKAPKA